MWRGTTGVMIVMMLAVGGRNVDAQSNSPRVRPESTGARTLIERGMDRSATFRSLNTGLDSGDVVVYVRFASCTGGVPSCLVWAAKTDYARRLLIKIDRFGRSTDELTALLAHELQHANEVAADAAITDLVSFQKSFASLGWKHAAGLETEQAARVSRIVAAELSRR